MTFQLDTTGEVVDTRPGWAKHPIMRWSDLSPFTQGYIEALFSGGVAPLTMWPCRFRDLAPETLARIIADCERKVEIVGPPILNDQGVDIFWTAERGARFWLERQGDECGENFPPLTVQLGDDGKVRFA